MRHGVVVEEKRLIREFLVTGQARTPAAGANRSAQSQYAHSPSLKDGVVAPETQYFGMDPVSRVMLSFLLQGYERHKRLTPADQSRNLKETFLSSSCCHSQAADLQWRNSLLHGIPGGVARGSTEGAGRRHLCTLRAAGARRAEHEPQQLEADNR